MVADRQVFKTISVALYPDEYTRFMRIVEENKVPASSYLRAMIIDVLEEEREKAQ